MPQQPSRTDPLTVAAAVQGAFAVMAARIGARQDSRLLVDNDLVTREVIDLVSLTLDKLDDRLGAGLGGAAAPDAPDEQA